MARSTKNRTPANLATAAASKKEERLLNEMTRLFNDLAVLQRQTAKQKADLEKTNLRLREALAEVKRLQGLLPICASCKKIRDANGEWHVIEDYISDHSEAQFSHGICPQCAKRIYPEVEG